MAFPRRMHTLLRGPVRTRLRTAQAAHPRLLAPRTITGPPDYVGIGAQRCGTSWWHSLIEQHPRVVGLGLGAKELHFFDDPWADSTERATAAERYAAHFRRAPGQLIGEWTPRYLWDPWAVPALLEAAPAARLLVMLRDPVERFTSGLRHAAKFGRVTPDQVNAVYSRGLYAAQLAPVVDLVPPERLLVLQLERCILEPADQLDRTFGFLGLDPVPVDPARGERNQAVAAQSAPPELVDAARAGYRADAARLATLLPGQVDLALWPRLVAE